MDRLNSYKQRSIVITNLHFKIPTFLQSNVCFCQYISKNNSIVILNNGRWDTYVPTSVGWDTGSCQHQQVLLLPFNRTSKLLKGNRGFCTSKLAIHVEPLERVMLALQ